MKKILVLGAILSLALWGCSDDSSSVDADHEGLAASSSAAATEESDDGDEPEPIEAPQPESNGSAASSESREVFGQALGYNLECVKEYEESGKSDVASTTASLVVEDDSVFVQVERLMMQCALVVTGVEMKLSGDTLYPKIEVDESAPQANCLCPTRLSFTLAKDFSSGRFITISGRTFPLSRASSESSEIPKSGFLRGECKNDVLAKTAAVTGEALLERTTRGEPYIDISGVYDYCDLDAEISQTRSGDTLFVEYANMGAVSKCICKFDYHRIFIDEKNTDALFVSFKEGLYRIVSLTVD